MIPSYGEKSSISFYKNIKFNGKNELKCINKMVFTVFSEGCKPRISRISTNNGYFDNKESFVHSWLLKNRNYSDSVKKCRKKSKQVFLQLRLYL